MLELDPYEIAYVHVAGGVERDGLYHDTHVHPTPPAVLELVAELCARRDSPGVMLERDDAYPPEAELAAELDAISTSAGDVPGPSVRQAPR